MPSPCLEGATFFSLHDAHATSGERGSVRQSRADRGARLYRWVSRGGHVTGRELRRIAVRLEHRVTMTDLSERAAGGTQPPYLYPPYTATRTRAPGQPLIMVPLTVSETSGPVFGHRDVDLADADLTCQHAGAPIGERIRSEE